MALKEELTETTPDVPLTERAASELAGMIVEHNKQGASLRIWVAGGG